MLRNRFALWVVLLLSITSICGQSRIDEHGVVQVPEDVIAASKRLHDLLQKPDFITLRLTYGYMFEKPVDLPQPYRVGDSMHFELFVSQSVFENIVIEQSRWSHYEYRPELRRDGEILTYSKQAQKAVEKAEGPPDWSIIPIKLIPGREYHLPTVRLDDWYEPLGQGHYELIVRKRFVWDGDWVESNPVIFEVVSRKLPGPMPDGISVEMVPDAFQKQPRQKLYRLRVEDYIVVVVVNDSDSDLSVPVIDLYYGNRPQLFKDGVALTYLDEIVKLLKSKEKDSRRVELGQNLSVPAHSRAGLQVLDLRKWFGELAPGQYKLINRRRFEIDGPWTADSAELLFEIVR